MKIKTAALLLILGLAPELRAEQTSDEALLVINGHQSLTSDQSITLENTAKQLGEAGLTHPEAIEQLLLVLSQPDRGLFKRALAMRALFHAGKSHEALRMIEHHSDLALLELITSTLATHGYNTARR
jgi:hypothetical protein